MTTFPNNESLTCNRIQTASDDAINALPPSERKPVDQSLTAGMPSSTPHRFGMHSSSQNRRLFAIRRWYWQYLMYRLAGHLLERYPPRQRTFGITLRAHLSDDVRGEAKEL